MKRTMLMGCAVVAGALWTAGASAETFQLSIGSGHPTSSAWIGTIKDFYVPKVTERVEKETGHKIVWREAFGGAVCKLGECLEAAESGLLDIVSINTPFEPAKLMAHNFAYHVPFGPTDPRVGAKVAWEVYEQVPELKKMLEDKYNQVYLGVALVGNYGVVSKAPWTEIAELRNRKIAAAGPNLPWLSAIGAVPVQGNLNDAYTSLQTGVYEGWVMFPDGVTSFKLNEVAPHFVDTGFGTVPTPLLTMNKDSYEGLPDNVRKILHEVARDWNRHEGDVIAQRQADAMKTLNAKPLSDAERQKWAAAMPNIPKLRTEELKKAGQPAEVISAYIRIVKEAGHTFPRDWAAEQ